MKEGEIFKISAPFLKCEYRKWVHGIDFKDSGCGAGVADEEGYAEFKIIKIVDLPKPYKPRIFFVRRMTNPDGRKEKWRDLEVAGEKRFNNIISGKKWNYEVVLIEPLVTTIDQQN